MTQTALGSFEQDIAFYTAEPYRDYRPQFEVETQDERTVWLTDHGRRIALLEKSIYNLDLFEFEPGKPRFTNVEKPAVYHAPLMLGARITLVQWVGAQGRTSDTYDLQIDEQPERITLTITETWKKLAQHSVKRLTLQVDPRFGYVIATDDVVTSDKLVSVEVYNFLVQGITHHHPKKRRFPLVVWHNPQHGLLKWTSNMASLRAPGQRDYQGTRNLGRDGWAGFLGEPDWNPVFAWSETTTDCSIATCDNLLDEHFCFAGGAPKGDKYELVCRGMLLSLPGPVAATISARAKFNELKALPLESQLRPFCLDQLCDFETSIPLGDYFRGQYWSVPQGGDEWATVSDVRARSGRWALRLRVKPANGEKSIMPIGSTMWLDTGRTYRLSAHACYVGRGPAKLRLQTWQGYFSYAENREYQEAAVTGEKAADWQRLELTFTVIENDPCAVVYLAASGDGDWFVDDMLLEEVR